MTIWSRLSEWVKRTIDIHNAKKAVKETEADISDMRVVLGDNVLEAEAKLRHAECSGRCVNALQDELQCAKDVRYDELHAAEERMLDKKIKLIKARNRRRRRHR